MPPAHTRIYPPVFPDQSNPPPGHPTPRMDAERIVLRWLIVGVIIIISIAVLRAILRYRPWEDFVRADDLETDTPTDLESVLGDAQYLGHYRDVPNQPTLPVPGGNYPLDSRPNDDPYEAGVASLVSLATNSHTGQNSHNMHAPLRNVNEIQRLLAKFRVVSYSAQSDPENHDHRRRVEELQRRIGQLVMADSRYALHALPEPVDPPPAYSQAVRREHLIPPSPQT